MLYHNMKVFNRCNRWQFNVCAACAWFVLLISPQPGWAWVTWDGSSSVDWSDVANWDSAPVANDPLVFSAAGQTFQPANNDIVGGTYSGITFNAGVFTNDVGADNLFQVTGNPFQLGAGGFTASAIGVGRTVDVQTDVELTSNAIIANTQAGSLLILSGNISGAFGLSRGVSGGGTVRLTGDNSFTGGLIWGTSGGLVEFTSVANTGTNSALGAAGTINIRAGGIRYIGTDPAGHSTNRPIVQQDGGGGLNGIEASGVGTLVLNGNIGSGSPRNNRFHGTGVGIANGTITLNGSASYPFVKSGSGTWILGGTTNNSIRRGEVQAGTLILAKNNALGTGTVAVTNESLVNAGATLGFQGNINYSTQMPLRISGTGDAGNSRAGAIDNISGTNQFAGPILLAGNATIGASAGQLTLSGLITEDDALNSYTLTKNGPGTIVLANPSGNTYQGGTIVQQGTLRVTNLTGSATGIGTVQVAAAGTLSGNGIIAGAVTVEGAISPGVNTGEMTLQSGLTFDANSNYIWEINDWNGSQGVNYDYLDITGTLAFTSTSSDPFVLSIESLDALNSPGPVPNYDPMADHDWTIASASGGITGLTASNYLIDTSNFASLVTGSFYLSLENGGNDLVLNYLAPPIPEPSSLALCALGSLLALRKRNRGKTILQ